MSNEQNNLKCDECFELLKTYRGSKTLWMSENNRRVLFCPCCGQIFIKNSDSKEVVAITIDEYEVQGN